MMITYLVVGWAWTDGSDRVDMGQMRSIARVLAIASSAGSSGIVLRVGCGGYPRSCPRGSKFQRMVAASPRMALAGGVTLVATCDPDRTELYDSPSLLLHERRHELLPDGGDRTCSLVQLVGGRDGVIASPGEMLHLRIAMPHTLRRRCPPSLAPCTLHVNTRSKGKFSLTLWLMSPSF